MNRVGTKVPKSLAKRPSADKPLNVWSLHSRSSDREEMSFGNEHRAPSEILEP